MKILLKHSYFLLLLIFQNFYGQIDTQKENFKKFTNIKEALLNPENVIYLDLSNQTEGLPNIDFSRFKNLQYLNLKNNHLTKIPEGIYLIKTLKTLDLSGNDFDQLPNEFSKLENLEEVYLNDESKINLPETLQVLSQLPKLKRLHLENDNITTLPKEILSFKKLEYLYLNDNKLKSVPKIKNLDHLRVLDLKNNNIKPELQDMKNLNFGLKINF